MVSTHFAVQKCHFLKYGHRVTIPRFETSLLGQSSGTYSREKGERRMFENIFPDASTMLVLTFWLMLAMIGIFGVWLARRK